MTSLELVGVHHIAVPVVDVLGSRDWYATVLGLTPVLVEEEEDEVTAVTLEQAAGNLTLCLMASTRAAQSLAGFTLFGLAVRSREDLEQWERRMDALSVAHTPIRAAHLGWAFDVVGPDQIRFQLRTADPVSGDIA